MCFSLGWIEQLLVWLVIIFAIVAILRLLIPWIAGKLGGDGGVIVAAINIVLWAFIAICVIYFVFALIACLGGSGLPLLPHHRY